MRCLQWFLVILSFISTAQAKDPETEFYTGLSKLEAEFRSATAKRLLQRTDRIEIYLLKFDGLVDDVQDDPFADLDAKEETIKVAPLNKTTKILESKTLAKEERAELLAAFTKQIAISNHSGGAACHLPIHGVRFYRGGTLLCESTFCWVCRNIGFAYPVGAGWLDISPQLEKIFNRLLPIPKAELERFEKLQLPNIAR